MDTIDQPVAFGQHINAEITSQILDSQELLASILSLMPSSVDGSNESGGNSISDQITDLIERIPQPDDIRALKIKFRNDENPLNVVLIQEMQRYNVLLDVVKHELEQLELGIKGFVVITPKLEEVMRSLSEGRVPASWGFAYFSQKGLGNWFADLGDRYGFLSTWAATKMPYVFWISAFTYPTGFTTSLNQRFSRKLNGPSIDRQEFDFSTVQRPISDITEHAKEGAFVTGLFLEGAKWDHEKGCLAEPEVMELKVRMPVIHFKPIQKRSKPPQNIYDCPTYYYPKRSGTTVRDSF